MVIRVVQLGSARGKAEGPRIGTVRRPPRGVPKAQFSSGNWYDVWLPLLAPSAELVKQALQAETAAEWSAFSKRYRAEMAAPEARQTIALLSTLSHSSNFSLGCYCKDEARCHRSILRTLLAEQGAKVE